MSELDQKYLKWAQELEKAERRVVEFESALFHAEEHIETLKTDLREALDKPPEWGNCRRGCQESYLDPEGFCSPACHLGAPKGKWVTLGVA
jgi:hypothetical protein